MELAKHESVCIGVRMALEARGSQVVNSILRLVLTHEPLESPPSRAFVES